MYRMMLLLLLLLMMMMMMVMTMMLKMMLMTHRDQDTVVTLHAWSSLSTYHSTGL